MIGDLIGSFTKRRIGIKSGDPAPLLDQLTFIFGAIILSSFFVNYNFMEIISIIIITPPTHFLTNYLAYRLKIKKVPW